MGDLESSPEDIAAKIGALFSELNDLIRKMDKKIEGLIRNDDHCTNTYTSDLNIHKKIQQVFKERVDELQSEFFCSEDGNGSHTTNLKILPKHENRKMVLILLKRKIENLKKEQAGQIDELSAL